ncbi:MAG: hypothetical protein PHV30_05105 [Candidatus Margulisbacteria bacterium]|nr:hypothetical protein [Candidatus Margulisiibacteriota bacterium]
MFYKVISSVGQLIRDIAISNERFEITWTTDANQGRMQLFEDYIGADPARVSALTYNFLKHIDTENTDEYSWALEFVIVISGKYPELLKQYLEGLNKYYLEKEKTEKLNNIYYNLIGYSAQTLFDNKQYCYMIDLIRDLAAAGLNFDLFTSILQRFNDSYEKILNNKMRIISSGLSALPKPEYHSILLDITASIELEMLPVTAKNIYNYLFPAFNELAVNGINSPHYNLINRSLGRLLEESRKPDNFAWYGINFESFSKNIEKLLAGMSGNYRQGLLNNIDDAHKPFIAQCLNNISHE